MYHPIPRNWLLATNKIEVEFNNANDTKRVHGSGFWIRRPTGLVFATNRHIVDIEYSDTKYRGCGYWLSSIQILTFNANGGKGRQVGKCAQIFTHEDPDVDIALLEVSAVENPSRISVEPANMEVIADLDFQINQLEWGALVSFTSFQPWRDTESERPILRTGILSSDPTYPFVSEKANRRDIHLLEAFSFAGSSGSPVIANARGIQVGVGLSGSNFRPAKIIGIMTGHLPINESEAGAPYTTHTGLSFCHRSDLLLAMLHGSAPIERSTFSSS